MKKFIHQITLHFSHVIYEHVSWRNFYLRRTVPQKINYNANFLKYSYFSFLACKKKPLLFNENSYRYYGLLLINFIDAMLIMFCELGCAAYLMSGEILASSWSF